MRPRPHGRADAPPPKLGKLDKLGAKASAKVSRRTRARRQAWLWAGGVSLLWHAFVALPGFARLQDPPDRELEITYMEPEPPPEPPSPDKPPEPPKPDEPVKTAKTQTPPKEPDKPPPPEEPAKRLEAKKPDKPLPKPPEPPPLEVTPMAHLKMVDQEQFPEEQDNDQAHFLAQKNHRAAQDTQSNSRNLVQNMTGEQVPSAPANSGEQPGENQHKVAELQDRPGDPKHLPSGAPPGLVAPAPPSLAMSPLAMRNPREETPRSTAPEAHELSPDGLQIQRAAIGPDALHSQGKSERAVGVPGQPGESPFRLNNHDYDRVIGYDVAEQERRTAALAQQSHAPGRWDRLEMKQAMLRSALENFTPNVRVGNQSELGTRAHPFAAYIAALHRQIHKFWGDGFLAELDHRPGLGIYPLNLVTALEISLKPDGTINQVLISRPSGVLPFDTAALEAVHMAAPFPAPPSTIKSRDGNVYVTWLFHRDDRQCATDFVSAHILTTPGKPAPAAPAVSPAPRPAGSESGQAGLTPPKPTLGRLAGGLPAGATRAALNSAAAGGSSAAAAGNSTAPVAPAAEPTTSTAPAAKSKPTSGVPDEARSAAERWLTGYRKSDVRWLTGSSALPFTAGGKTVAEDGPGLRTFYQVMLAEGAPKHDRVHYYTADEIKKRRGHLPRGGEEDDMAFAWVELGGEDLILILQPANKGWRVVGIER